MPLKPGMTAMVDIRTGQRSVLKYLAKPVYVAFAGALNERWLQSALVLDSLSSNDYNRRMFSLKALPEFDAWLSGVRDRQTRFKLLRRLEKVQRGLLGDVAPVGDGVFEMREFFGPGWRMYKVQQKDIIIVMLGGGDKSSQVTDIAKAKSLASNLKEF